MEPEKAWDLFTLKAAIERHNRSSLSTEIILSIFFEESQFCNRRQITDSGKDGPGQRLWPDGDGQSRQAGITTPGRFAHRPAEHTQSPAR